MSEAKRLTDERLSELSSHLTPEELEMLRDFDALTAERDAAEAQLRAARDALERIASHPTANALILTAGNGSPMIGVGTLAKDTLARLNQIATPSV